MNCYIKRWFKKIDFFEENISFLSNSIFSGRVSGIKGLIIEAVGFILPIGSYCFIEVKKLQKKSFVVCKVIGFKKNKIFLVSFEGMDGIFCGSKVLSNVNKKEFSPFISKNLFPYGSGLLGRVLDCLGRPIDGLGCIKDLEYKGIYKDPINPLKRKLIREIFDCGIRSINGFLTIGKGQRIGIFSRPGVGKSMLLGMLTRHSISDIIIVALVGERGREVKEFIENVLGPEDLKKTIIIVALADSSPIFRTQAAIYATSVSEFFRKKNKNVLLIIDSLTRYAMAYRELSLSLGEQSVSKGYPVSIFSNLPFLLERTGNSSEYYGSITAFYTVLTEGDEFNDPISDISKSILDGHINLSGILSNSGFYPSIDIESSISRSMRSLISLNHYNTYIYFKKIISYYNANKDLVNLGAYNLGTDLFLDKSIKIKPFLDNILQQDFLERCSYHDSVNLLYSLSKKYN